ncbi:hypothetical protein [Macrococcus capreoli]|uniref:hypothetical protein n=1 Tax=Macrococcus capreoli TaxID=2982690 RepID=UPI003EE7BA4E
MQVKNNSFPYPVLSSFTGDYINDAFDLDVEVINQFNQLYLNGTFKLTSPSIDKLIVENKATYLVHVECGLTSFRKALTFKENTFKMPIERQLVKGKLEINGFVVAIEDIQSYSSQNFDEMYESLQFDINKGNILAVTDRIDAIIYEENEDYKDMTSIINIRKSDTEEYMKIDHETDKITIILPKNSYELYAQYAKSAFKEVIITNVIFPALIHVFAQVEHNKKEYEDNRWYQVLKEILEQSSVNIETIGDRGEAGYVVVQKLLHNPVMKSLDAIKMFSEAGEDE